MAAGRRERLALWVAIFIIAGLIWMSYRTDGPRPSREIPDASDSQPLVPSRPPDLLRAAADHIQLAESSMRESMLWGRIGGSRTERASARLLQEQLRPWSDAVGLESFEFSTHRPVRWTLEFPGAGILESAMPAPFDAKFPAQTHAPVKLVLSDDDWNDIDGHWAFIFAGMTGSAARNVVRERLLYERAVESGAVGLIFSLPTPPGVWRTVVPVDKPFALHDERYPDGVRPIPCFAIDNDDGQRVANAVAQQLELRADIEYAPGGPLEGLNTVGTLDGQGELRVVLAAHLDSFFAGANDDASGLATLVGLAHRLSRLPIEQRKADFLFVGLSAHHDASAGMRDFVARDAFRYESIDQVILLEHTDAQPGPEGIEHGWPLPLNDARDAYLGSGGWPEIHEDLPDLVRDTGMMTILPRRINACIADLFVVCGEMKTFCLIQAPPYYHTDHDTLDKLSAQGLSNAVEFHFRLLEVTGAIVLETGMGDDTV